jgi:NAD-dependent SIR2 family protein deacetylase
MTQELVEAIRDKAAILFVGAGVSINLGLPSFNGLIRHLASELNYDPDVYSAHGDYFALAEGFVARRSQQTACSLF